MKYILSLTLLGLLATGAWCQIPANPMYTGLITYASGSFGGDDAPQKGDSILVYVKNGDQSNFIVLVGHDVNKQPRTVNINFNKLSMLREREYEPTVTKPQQVHSVSYDRYYSSSEMVDDEWYQVNLTHFADGSSATLTVIGQDKELIRVDNILIANLKRVK